MLFTIWLIYLQVNNRRVRVPVAMRSTHPRENRENDPSENAEWPPRGDALAGAEPGAEVLEPTERAPAFGVIREPLI